MTKAYAHSLEGRPVSEWEELAAHLVAVAQRAAAFAAAFGMAEAGWALGMLHDIGKASAEFLAYISAAREQGRTGPNHSTAGAREAVRLYAASLGRMLAYAIAGHHAGLADYDGLDERLSPDRSSIPNYDGWEAHVGTLPPAADLLPKSKFKWDAEPGFRSFFMTRMLFSALVDADYLATEAFYAQASGEPVRRGGHASLEALRDRLRTFMAEMQAQARPTLRRQVLDHVTAKAEASPGLFTLTVPTGGGKTLASLSFALEHAVRHGLRRVVFVVPYTAIIDQTVNVFQEALKTRGDVLEHHSGFDWDREEEEGEADHEGRAGLNKLRKAAENWDVPIVVTTAVQFYESLFAARTSKCRKLHNLAQSVIVLDEAQTLPSHVLRPCLAAIGELAGAYGSSVVLCTATQPAWRRGDEALPSGLGLEISADRELAPDPINLYAQLRRVTAEVRGPTDDDQIVAGFVAQPRMLCIVNTRGHAQRLYGLIRDLPGATHLSTLMCPAHRRRILEDVRARLRAKEPVRLISTSLIEAGVDVDFPEVWRAEAGLDSIAQAAGRCNREGELDQGRLVIFTPAEHDMLKDQKPYRQALRDVVRAGRADLLGLEANLAYFRQLYFQKGAAVLDRVGVMQSVKEGKTKFDFPFRSIAKAFRLIDEVMEPVVVPYDDRAVAILAEMKAEMQIVGRPLARHLRALQPYTVSIPRRARDLWLARGVLRPPHPAFDEGLLCFEDLAHYREETGVNLADLEQRDPGSNCVG